MIERRTFLTGLAACSVLVAPVKADKFPNRPIRLLIGFAGGGITDLTARMLSDGLSPLLGEPWVVESKSGAGGNIAMAELARSAPDGHTLMLATPGQLVVNPRIQASVGFDPSTRFSLIGMTGTSSFVVVVPSGAPFRSIGDLVAWGKAHPGKLTFGSPGIGSTIHIGGEMLNAFTGIGAVHVPYRGGAMATADLVAGRIDFMIDALASTMPSIASGQLRVIGVTGSRRMARFPDAPALAETYPDFELSSWLG